MMTMTKYNTYVHVRPKSTRIPGIHIIHPDGRKPAKYTELVMRYALCSHMQQDERPKSMSLSFVDRIGEGGIGGSGISASCRIT